MAQEGDALSRKVLDLDLHGALFEGNRSEVGVLPLRSEVDSGARVESRHRRHRRAEFGGGLVEGCPEGAGEGLVGLVAGVEGDLGDGTLARLEQDRRALEPQPANVLLDRFPDHAAEDAVEVER